MAAFLGQVSRRKVDGDSLGREREAHRGERGVNTLATLPDRFVGQADHIELRHARRDLALHLDRARVEAEISHRRYECDHSVPPDDSA